MQCPVDQTVLQMSDRQGVEIDYCPTCRGVWLDRGELDKLIDRSLEVTAPPPSRPEPSSDDRRDDRHEDRREYQHDDRNKYDDRYRSDHSRDSKGYKKKRKESFLGELFDF